MEFASVNGIKRPIRCRETTRAFAWESLGHKYGLDARKTPAVSLDDIPGVEDMAQIRRYDAAIRRIAEEAPVRICENEMLSGAATLGDVIDDDRVPATLRGKNVFPAVSHLTTDFESVVRRGLDGIRADVTASYEKYKGTPKEPFMESCINTLDSFDIWHRRYLDALRDRPGYEANYRNLLRVPHHPAETFYEAVQSIWFCFAFLRLCGNWPGIGRLDHILGPYYERDIRDGRLTENGAREILAHFFIKGCEWIDGSGWASGSGDAQYYQNIVLGGIDEDGNEVTNGVTYLILDVIEEFGISDFPTTVRLNRNTDGKLLRRIAEVTRLGGGVLAVYNEELIIRAMTDYGYELKEARRFANDGCWEVQVPGKTYFRYRPFDSLQLLQHRTLKDYAEDVDFPDYESLYQAYLADLKDLLEEYIALEFRYNLDPSDPWKWREKSPCTAVSLFVQGCVEKGLSYLEGGAVYNVLSPHMGGLADTVNSLYALKKLVFEEKKIGFADFMTVLRENWEGAEALRRYVTSKYVYYGNDSDEADGICRRLLSDFADLCGTLDHRCMCMFPGGVSTFGRQLEWAPERLACPYGRKKGEVLAANASPTPGTDMLGATAIIRSYCKNDLAKLPVGAALDVKLLPSCTAGEEGLEAMAALFRGFVQLGGFFMQPDVVDAAILKLAQEKPEEYRNLSVRVSGWNARFVTLNREWQDMVIRQNECGCRY